MAAQCAAKGVRSLVVISASFAEAGAEGRERQAELLRICRDAGMRLIGPNCLGIVNTAGGPGILCADTCEAEVLAVPPLSDETQARLRTFLPPTASVTNPVDMIATATAGQFEQCVEAILGDPNVDAVIAIFIPPLATRSGDVAKALVAALGRNAGTKPLLAVFMTSARAPSELGWKTGRIPGYQFPEAAATALAHAVRYGVWQIGRAHV